MLEICSMSGLKFGIYGFYKNLKKTTATLSQRIHDSSIKFKLWIFGSCVGLWIIQIIQDNFLVSSVCDKCWYIRKPHWYLHLRCVWRKGFTSFGKCVQIVLRTKNFHNSLNLNNGENLCATKILKVEHAEKSFSIAALEYICKWSWLADVLILESISRYLLYYDSNRISLI